MKKFKYLFTFIFALVLLPTLASAKETIYFQDYNVGDEITVTLDADGKIKGKFIVVEASPEGEQKNVESFVKGNEAFEYVTAMYVGTLGSSPFTSGKEVTYTSSVARSSLVINATDAGWTNYEEIRLLTLADLKNIGISDNKVSASYLLTYAPYWLGEDMQGTSAYSVLKDGTVGLTLATDTKNIIPVIRIHKGWVEDGMICNCDDCMTDKKYCPNDSTISIQDCIDSGKSESVCIMQLCTKEVKYCPADKTISIQECLDEGNSEEACVEKLCPQDKVCPNDSSIDIQTCIDSGKSEEDCIKNLCPGSEKVENPKTGTITFGIGLIVLLVTAYFVSRKCNYFEK
jgi:hypothetical protein